MQALASNLALTLVLWAAAEDRGAAEARHFWPQWRGPLATGVAPYAQPPVVWGEGKNIRWKTALPGKGHSTPIVGGTASSSPRPSPMARP